MSDVEQKGAKYISSNLYLHPTVVPTEDSKDEKLSKLEWIWLNLQDCF